MNDLIKKILIEWSFRLDDGIINLHNPKHMIVLSEVLKDMKLPTKVILEVMGNLTEKKKPGDVWKTKTGWAGLKAGEDKAQYGMDSKETAQKYVKDGETTPTGPNVFGQPQTSTEDEATKTLNKLTSNRDDIFTGKTTPPGTGGSAVMETIGGEYSEELAQGKHQNETEEQFVERQLKEKGDKPPLNSLSDKDKRKWLKIAYKKGKNDINELKNDPIKDYNPKQPKGFPKAASGDADTAEPVLNALEQKRKECDKDPKPDECRKHYDREINEFNARVRKPGERASGKKDTDSMLIYYDNNGRVRIEHISDKSSLNDTYMNMTIETKSLSHQKASKIVGKDMGLTEEQTKKVSSSISNLEKEVGEEVRNTSELPHKSLKEKSDDEIKDSVDNGLGGAMGNADAGQTGRKDYTIELNSNMKAGKDKALKKKLDELGLEPDNDGNYSKEDIAVAIMHIVRENPKSGYRKYVLKMGGTIETTRKTAEIVERSVRKKAEKEEPKPTEEEIQNRINQETADRMNGNHKEGRKQNKDNPAEPLSSEDIKNMRKEGGIMDELLNVNRTSKDAMGEAHKKVKQHMLDEDKKLGFPKEDGENGPHTQTYLESWMTDMHWNRHFDGPPWEEDGDDNGDESGSINVGGKVVKSQLIVECIKDITGYPGNVETKEDKKKFWEYLRKNLKISSDNDAVTINSDKGTKQVGRQNYRSAGAGVQKVTGNMGNDIQKCLKRKLKESEQV